MRTIVLDKFAIIGQSDIDTQEDDRNWSIISLSKQFTNEKRELQISGTGQIDLVINNGTILACFSLQECKIVESSLAINMIRRCSTCYLTSNGNFLFGMEPSGDIFVCTDGLKSVKHVMNPSVAKLQPSSGLYDFVSRTVGNIVGFFSGRNSQVSPNLDSQQHGNMPSLPQDYKSVFPYITASSDGLIILCALSPEDCFVFLTSYETALRNRSIANLKESQVPGRWYCIDMDKNFVMRWLEGKRSPFFEGKLCYLKDENRNSVIGGAMLYSVLEGNQLEVVYGINKKSNDSFSVSWERIQYELNLEMGLRETTMNLEMRYITRLSQDCSKLAIVVSTSDGFYTHVEHIPSCIGGIVKLERTKMTFCNHWDSLEYTSKRGCYISDVQWLVGDAYFACITRCGCLSIFHATGEPMLIETSHTGEENDSSTFLPVLNQCPISGTQSKTKYPILKWMGSEKILTCSTANIVEAFSIKRVISYRSRSSVVEQVKKANNISSSSIAIPRIPSCNNNVDSANSAFVNQECKAESESNENQFKTNCDAKSSPSKVKFEPTTSITLDDCNGNEMEAIHEHLAHHVIKVALALPMEILCVEVGEPYNTT